MEKVLNAREVRSNLISSFATNTNVIIIKANIVGLNKNPYFAYLIINVFYNLIMQQIQICNHYFYESADGPFYLLETKSEKVQTKQYLIKLEDEHQLGRLVDLDFYSCAKKISRKDLNQGFRKCLLCDNAAIFCMKNKSHSVMMVYLKQEEIVKQYLRKLVHDLLDLAITTEARLEPKFGLVTLNTRGSHSDMDFSLLMRVKDVIVPDLVSMFFCGFDNELESGFLLARSIGIKTEEKMFKETNGVNVYKGLIFILGIIAVCLGNSIKNNEQDLFTKIKIISKDLIPELKTELKTFGKYAYDNFGFLGIRGEASKGLVNVFKVKEMLISLSNEVLTMALTTLIKNVEDTVLLKRSKTIEKYEYFKNLVGSIDNYDLEVIARVTSECIKESISFGGSADLLVASIFISLIEREFGVIYGF